MSRMANTYNDLIDAMVEAEKRGMNPTRVTLTEETMDVFLADEQFSKSSEVQQDEHIGTDWALQVETGDVDQLVCESGERISL